MWSILVRYELGELPQEPRVVVASDVLDVPEARFADFGWFGVVAEPVGAGPVWAAGARHRPH
jgi:hypothetical protein